MIIDRVPADPDKLAALREWWFELPEDHPDRQVEYLLGEISQAVSCASWLMQIDQDAWDLLFEGHPDPTVQAALADLRSLTVDHGWWPRYDWSPDGDPFLGCKIPLQQWSDSQPVGRRAEDLPPRTDPPRRVPESLTGQGAVRLGDRGTSH